MLKRIIKLIKGDDGWRKCPKCDGTGKVNGKFVNGVWIKSLPRVCHVCDGVGEFYIPTHQEMG